MENFGCVIADTYNQNELLRVLRALFVFPLYSSSTLRR